MKIAVRYYTRSGNTKKLADAIAKAVSVESCDITVPHHDVLSFFIYLSQEPFS